MINQLTDTELKATNGGAYLNDQGEVIVTAPTGMLGSVGPRGGERPERIASMPNPAAVTGMTWDEIHADRETFQKRWDAWQAENFNH